MTSFVGEVPEAAGAGGAGPRLRAWTGWLGGLSSVEGRRLRVELLVVRRDAAVRGWLTPTLRRPSPTLGACLPTTTTSRRPSQPRWRACCTKDPSRSTPPPPGPQRSRLCARQATASRPLLRPVRLQQHHVCLRGHGLVEPLRQMLKSYCCLTAEAVKVPARQTHYQGAYCAMTVPDACRPIMGSGSPSQYRGRLGY